MPYRRSSRREQSDIWPGFVDALSSLLLVIIFLLAVFMLAQFFMSRLIQGQSDTVEQLQISNDALIDQLRQEEIAAQALENQLERQAEEQAELVDTLNTERTEAEELSISIEALRAERAELANELESLRNQIDASELDRVSLEEELASTRSEKDQAQRQASILGQQLVQLSEQVDILDQSLGQREQLLSDQSEQLRDLAQRLALARSRQVNARNTLQSSFNDAARERQIPDDSQEDPASILLSADRLFVNGTRALSVQGNNLLQQIREAARSATDGHQGWQLVIEGRLDQEQAAIEAQRQLSAGRLTALERFFLEQGISQEALVLGRKNGSFPYPDSFSFAVEKR